MENVIDINVLGVVCWWEGTEDFVSTLTAHMLPFTEFCGCFLWYQPYMYNIMLQFWLLLKMLTWSQFHFFNLNLAYSRAWLLIKDSHTYLWSFINIQMFPIHSRLIESLYLMFLIWSNYKLLYPFGKFIAYCVFIWLYM